MNVSNETIEKLRKLKALSDGAAKINSIAESESAAIALNRLLTKHNLSLMDIDGGEEKPTIDIKGSDLISVQNPYGRLWKERLLMTLCGYNYCRMVASSYKVFLIGTEINTLTVINLFNTLQSVYLSSAKEQYGKDRKYFRGAKLTEKYKRKYITSFLLGCSIGLSVKLNEIQTAESKAVAVCHKDKIEQYIDENYNVSKKTIKQPKLNESSYLKGYAKGLASPLQKTIGG